MSSKLITNADERMKRKTKFPDEFNQKVDMRKVNVPLIKKWIEGEVPRILKMEDDIVTQLVFESIESRQSPDIKQLQIDLTGFMGKDAPTFCKDLWKLCLSAQTNPNGVPQELLEAKRHELVQEKIERDKILEEKKRRDREDEERQRELSRIRERERRERDRARPRDDRYDRYDRHDRRGPRDYSRSPPPRRRRDSRSPPRRRYNDDDDRDRRRPERDVYVGSGRRGRRRSPSSSRSPSPPRRTRRNTSDDRSRNPSPTPPRKRRSRSRSRDRDRRKDRAGHEREHSRSRSPPRRKRRPEDDLMNRADARKDRRANPRLSRSPSSSSRSPPPPRDRKRRRRDTASPVETKKDAGA